MRNRVVIVGAGPNGLCPSKALAMRDLQVEVVERQSAEALAAPQFDGREIALTHASMRVLRELGVWQHIPAGAIAAVRGARIRDAAWRAVADAPSIRVHTG